MVRGMGQPLAPRVPTPALAWYVVGGEQSMAAQLETFYQTVSQVCFTLLGFWLIVLQTKYQEWSGKAERRRMIVNISLYFLLPGTMSLLAMLAIQATAI